jgi:hypothetical protein
MADLRHLVWLGNEIEENGVMVIKQSDGDYRIKLDRFDDYWNIEKQIERAYEQGKRDANDRMRYFINEAMTVATRSP